MSRSILFLTLLVLQGLIYGQDMYSSIQLGRVEIDLGVEVHQWTDSSSLQFVALSVAGLPEINTMFSPKTPLSVQSLVPPQEVYSGGYNFPILISSKQTLQPVMTTKEMVYDSISKSNEVKHTSLYLLDDFKQIKKREALIVYSRGCFGYVARSHIDCNDFLAVLYFDKSNLSPKMGKPKATRKWYEDWLKHAPDGYWDPRKGNFSGDMHRHYDSYLEKINGKSNRK